MESWGHIDYYTQGFVLESVLSTVGSALALGARGPGFKSRHPDYIAKHRHIKPEMTVFYVQRTECKREWNLVSLLF